MLLCFLLLNAIFLAVIPICRTLWLLILSTAAAGFSVGILDTATNVQLIGIHGKKVKLFFFFKHDEVKNPRIGNLLNRQRLSFLSQHLRLSSVALDVLSPDLYCESRDIKSR